MNKPPPEPLRPENGPGCTHRIELRIDSCLQDVKLVGLCVRAVSGLRFSGIPAAEIELAVVEAVTNCIQHSYRGEAGNDITVVLVLEERTLVVEIQDHGAGMDPRDFERIPKQLEFDPFDLHGLPQEGMGVAIIKSVMDEAEYQVGARGNLLRLTKRLTGSRRP